ncbi:NAD(P)-dependent oxidoreductase [Lewinella sp. W8]|uniref:NAD(P)-dependent oxidoreductase n=1 Tax=Lewinella sp. W8 TaxID=2528208 RepID=UPI001068CCE2|nr:NAD(P)-dependent oxidoreductase [Lewinella sp. W8]MTB50474.1 alanine dehydrogenase [Lewinella sp. W8]
MSSAYPTIAVIREGKVPPDSRTPLNPTQAATLRAMGVDLVVQPSTGRTFTDEEYRAAGVPVVEDISDRELLLGIKEVPIDQLIPNKTYCFFAHVAKEQPYNQPLMRAMLEKKITHIDYEYLTDERGRRLIAFGYWAGMVGAHNAVWTYAERRGSFTLPRLKDVFDYAEAKEIYARTTFPEDLKIVLTGTGRVGKGAAQVLDDMGIKKVSPASFLQGASGPVYTQLAVKDYAVHPDGREILKSHFYAHGEEYRSSFGRFAEVATVFINGIFWDGKAPAFFTREEMGKDNFSIEVIGDVTCDIAPAASVPSTLKASTIAEPVFGYDPQTGRETDPYLDRAIDVMSIDNLPSELPRDASTAFGETFIKKILPEFAKDHSAILERATVCTDGQLGPHFGYLKAYAYGEEG